MTFVLPAALAMLLFPVWRRAIAIISYLETAAVFLLPGIIDAVGPSVRQRYIIGPILLATLFASLWLQKNLIGRRYVRGFIVVFLLLTAVPLSQFAIHQFTIGKHQSRAEVALQRDAVRRPNVYFILLDMYARADQLKSVLGFDNSTFLKALESFGFYIANKSYSSYPETTYSITTTFRMTYVQQLEPNLRETIFESATYQNFKHLRYRLVHLPQYKDVIRCPDGIECIFHESERKTTTIGQLGSNILGMLPVIPTSARRYFPSLFLHEINEPDSLLAFLNQSPSKQTIFLYAHFDMPHPPYIRDAECNPTPPSLHGDAFNLGSMGKDAYVKFLRCGNKKVLEIVKHIVENDPEAIIILESDHGSYFRRRHVPGQRIPTFQKGELWYRDALEEGYATLNAWRLPFPCRKWLTPDLSPINTFRLVFGCLTDSPPNFLPNRSYWVDEVTQRLLLLRQDNRWIVPTVERTSEPSSASKNSGK